MRWLNLPLATIREPLYRDVADLVFDSDGLSLSHAAERLQHLVEAQWQRAMAA